MWLNWCDTGEKSSVTDAPYCGLMILGKRKGAPQNLCRARGKLFGCVLLGSKDILPGLGRLPLELL